MRDACWHFRREAEGSTILFHGTPDHRPPLATEPVSSTANIFAKAAAPEWIADAGHRRRQPQRRQRGRSSPRPLRCAEKAAQLAIAANRVSMIACTSNWLQPNSAFGRVRPRRQQRSILHKTNRRRNCASAEATTAKTRDLPRCFQEPRRMPFRECRTDDQRISRYFDVAENNSSERPVTWYNAPNANSAPDAESGISVLINRVHFEPTGASGSVKSTSPS